MPSSADRITFFFERQRFQEAVQACQEALRDNPEDEFAFYVLGHCGLELKDHVLAQDAVRQLIRINPESPRGHELLGYLAIREKRLEQAERHVAEAIRLDPENPCRYATLGRLYAMSGRLEDGITAARRGMKIDPHDVCCLTALQVLYRLNEEPRLAQQFEDQLAVIDPENADLHFNAAVRLLDVGKRAAARTRFLESLRLQPLDDDSHQAMAHERVRTHPIFRHAIFPPVQPDLLIASWLTPVFWYALGGLWFPFRWIAWLTVAVLATGYGYRGLFVLCRWIALRRIRSGRA